MLMFSKAVIILALPFKRVSWLSWKSGHELIHEFVEALAEVLRCQQSAYTLRDGNRQHHLQRAKVCSKLIKYPNIEDYAVKSLHRVYMLRFLTWIITVRFEGTGWKGHVYSKVEPIRPSKSICRNDQYFPQEYSQGKSDIFYRIHTFSYNPDGLNRSAHRKETMLMHCTDTRVTAY